MRNKSKLHQQTLSVCPYCNKMKEDVKPRPSRSGYFTGCYECYEIQVLMS